MKRNQRILLLLTTIYVICTIYSCEKDKNPGETPPDTTPYVAPFIQNFRDMPRDAENPMTLEGIALGKRLFFDPVLSKDSSMSCAGCHKVANSFSDPSTKSKGVDGLFGARNAMALINLSWDKDRFFWDGRASTLRAQAVIPVEDPVEMHASWPDVAARVSRNDTYKELFWKAFGTRTATRDLITKAIEQYEKTLISYNSKFDQYSRGEAALTTSELRGFQIFTTEAGDCFHCHSTTAPETFISPDRTFANNGLDTVGSAADFADFGLGKFTGNAADNGRFKIPTLRNLIFTAPYMHDGRFTTLDEVIDFYNEGPKGSPTLEPIMREKANKRLETLGHWGLNLSVQQKADLKAFLLTLTDSTFIHQ